MSKFLSHKENVIKSFIALLFPVCLCLIYLGVRGISVGDIFLPASFNNDSSFYFKTVEGIIDGGMPYGYFGYNETHAIIGGMGAWNPAIYLPWVLWGKVFGWSFISPLICNIVLFSLSLMIYTLLTRPGNMPFAAELVILAFFPSLPIHLMSGLPEAVLGAHFILFLGVSTRACDLSIGDRTTGDNRWLKTQLIICILISFILIAFLTLIRPFLITFMAITIFVLTKAYGKKTLPISVIVFVVTVVVYYGLTKYYTAEYFTPLFDTRMIKAIFTGDFHDAVKMTIAAISETWSGVYELLSGAFRYGNTAGTQYIMSFMGLIAAMIASISADNRNRRVIYIVYSAALIMTFGAIFILLQLAPEGARHLWMFAVAGCLIFSDAFLDGIVKVASIALLCVFMLKGSLVPTDYDVPVGNEDFRKDIEEYKLAFKNIVVNSDTDNGYENTIDWVIRDQSANGELTTEYAPLYVLPSGMGISCCEDYYIADNIDDLKSKYIYTDLRGNVSELCKEKNMKVVACVGSIVVYENGNYAENLSDGE